MCNALWECLKCPAKVVCCCVSCTMKALCTILCSGILLLVVIGLILYFTVFQHHDDKSTKAANETVKMLAATVAPTSFRDYFHQQ
ncbi:protein midgut expression 1 isoform X1 [Episyrphus balteatus]|uniref:protein midgut expression 1 isoform X1 n=1 Tax=Episyrphus balteatus TaxID=286459 RepID=UPI002486A0BF|nr:protein midgut expression 1 isoform X1 [Episyrphus balteatus]